MDILIIGAGPTGLGAAWRIDEYGYSDWRLCEAYRSAGGLAGSVTDSHGFVWDFGGHVEFSHYEYFDRLMDDLLEPEDWLHHQRQAWVWLRGRFVPYPFQLNLHRLPDEERDFCLAGLQAHQSTDVPPVHFGEWIERCFGTGIATVFLRPYNLKVWGYPLEQMAWSWISDRVAVVEIDRVLDSINSDHDNNNWGPNRRFRYPRKGGTGIVWRTLAERLAQRHPGRLCMERRLLRLDTANHLAQFRNGDTICYQRLLSTIPLDALVRSSDLASALESDITDLKHSSTHIIGIGLYGRPTEQLCGKSWIYFSEDNCPFYRVTVFSHYSPGNVPDPQHYWSLLAEVTESPYKIVDRMRVAEETVQGLLNTGLVLDHSSIHHVWHHRLEYGYPIPSLSRDQALSRILPVLESRDIYSRGRFGAWKYEVSNQDHSFAQGVELVERWFDDNPETTLNHPEIINAR
ncbi:MAG: NAD(P)-binding protein [Pyrinomonadaceae bacterium]